MAVTINGLLNFQIETNNVNSSIFYNFIQNTINILTEKEYIFLFDNVRFHHNKEMLKLITSNGHKYVFTPPYSPNNNPIETIFSIIKYKYNKIKCKSENKVIKHQIENIIIKFKNEYNNLSKIFIRALSFNYNNIEKELKDRIIFIS